MMATREIGRSSDLAAWLNLAVAIALLNVGNLLLDSRPAVRGKPAHDIAKAAGISLTLFLSPAFLASIGCLGLAFVFYVRSLARLPLAVAYPVMVGISLIIVAIANHCWHQPLAAVQLAGVPLLFGGVVLISTAKRSP